MVRTLTTKRIIGDINIANFLENKCSKEIDIDEIMDKIKDFNEDRCFLPLVLNFKLYILLNTGIICFNHHPVIEGESIIIDSGITFPDIPETMKLTNINKDIKRGILTTIQMKTMSGRYFVVEKDYDFRVITSRKYLDYINKIPQIKIELNENCEYELKKPGILLPNYVSICQPQISKTFYDLFARDNTTKNIEYNVLYLILMYGYNFKNSFADFENIVYVTIDDKNIKNARLKEGTLFESYENFCKAFFKKEYADFLTIDISFKKTQKLSISVSKNGRLFSQTKVINCSLSKIFNDIHPIVFKEGNKLAEKDDSEDFTRIENELRKGIYVPSFCELFNFEKKENFSETFFVEVLSKESFFGKVQSPIRSPKREPQISLITEEEANKNAELLLAMEEEQNEKKISKKNKRKEREKEKKIIERNFERLKLLAKKIAIEAQKQYVKMDIERKRKIKLEKKHRLIAKKIAQEAKEYYDKMFQDDSSLPPFFPPAPIEILCEIEESYEDENSNHDEDHCEIGSEEFLRRVRDWDLSQIIPQIYCLPKTQLIEMFIPQKEESSNEESIWAFNLW